MEEPLLSGSGKWSSYEYVGRNGSAIPTASLAGTEVTVDEIRSAATSDRYPPSLHAALISSPEPYPDEQALVYQGGYGGDYGGTGTTASGFQGQILDEVEIRELLIDHVGHRCCWGSHPARTWKIHAVEDCNVYVGTLDTFVEEREVIKETEPYTVLFVPHKETRTKVPRSEIIEKCTGCEGRGDLVCPTCNSNQEPGYYNKNQMFQCPACSGRGLIAHRDGSDSICKNCSGKGKIPCATCGSQGLVKCEKCHGNGSLLTRSIAIVKWKTLSTRKVTATSGAASVPDEVFHRAKGVQLCQTQAHQCTPAFFADSFFLNKFSSEVIAERPSIPPTARVICERHAISVVPVTRVTMANRGHAFSFYIIGFSRELYLKDYYPARRSAKAARSSMLRISRVLCLD
ncbi:chaperone protein dnaJ-related [Euphorbia peplus]|nr:chaperone protein dnaJ-related [Euphorbia peplus]